MINKHLTIYDPDIFIGNFDDITSLKTVDTTNATDYPSYAKAFVSTEGQYFLDRNSILSESLPDVVAPTTGVGRWILVPNSLHENNVLTTINELIEKTDAAFKDTSITNLITVSNSTGGDFNSIFDAVDSITDASISNPYMIKVGPGVFVEPQITMKPYVSIQCSGEAATFISASNPNQSLIIGANDCQLTDCTITGVNGTSGEAAIYHASPGANVSAFVLKRVRFGQNKIHIKAFGNTHITTVLCIDCLAGSGSYNFEKCFEVRNNPGVLARVAMFNLTVIGVITPITTFADIYGTGCEGILTNIQARNISSSGTFALVDNGGSIRIHTCSIRDWDKGFHLPNNGTNSAIIAHSILAQDNTYDLLVENPTSTGFVSGLYDFSRISIHPDSSVFIPNKDSHIITVYKKGGDFTSVKDAIDSITDNAIDNSYLIKIGPGTFIEDTINMKEFVYVEGENTTIMVDAANKNCIIGAPNSSLSQVNLTGSTDGKALVYHTGGMGVFTLRGITFVDGHKFVEINSDDGPGIALITNSFGNDLLAIEPETCFDVSDSGTYPTQVAIFNYIQNYGGGNEPLNLLEAHGSSTTVVVNNTISGKTNGLGTAVNAYDGADVRLIGCALQGYHTSIKTTNLGDGPVIRTSSISTVSAVYDVNLQHPDTTGSMNGDFSRSKVLIDTDVTGLSLFYIDPTDQGTVTLGNMYAGPDVNNLVQIGDLITNSPAMGIYVGGNITEATAGTSAFDITISAGYGYLSTEPTPNNFVLKRIDWNTQNYTMPVYSSNYIYFNSSGILSISSNLPDTKTNIVLGRVETIGTGLEFIVNTPIIAKNFGNRLDAFNRDALGAIYSDGSIISYNGSRELSITAGTYYFSSTKFTPSAVSSPMTFHAYYRDGLGNHIITPTTIVPNNKYDNNSGTLGNVTAGYYTKHTLYVVGSGSDAKYLFVYAQAEYSTQIAAEGADIPAPPSYFTDGVVLIASIIVQEGNSAIVQVRDERPVIGFKASGVSASSDHGNLLGLSDDDHTQYLLANGGRAMSGNLDMGGNQITNVGNVDGVDVSSHSSRHLPNGSDPLTTAAPSANLGGSTTNSVGIANSLSRSDHSHAIDKADSGTTGLLRNTDWVTFNNKQNALTIGNLSETTSSILTISGGTGSVIGSGTTIRVKQADSGTSGYLSSTDWSAFNNKLNNITINGSNGSSFTITTSHITEGTNFYYTDALSRNALSGSAPISYNTSTGNISITKSDSGTNGYLSSTDWSTFNAKQNAITQGNLTEATSSVLTITGGSSSVIGSGTTIQVKRADSGTSGYLSNTDWTTFNSKQNVITQGNLTEATSSVLTITGGSSSVIGSGTTIRVKQADSGTSGYLSSTDWTTFNNKQNTITQGNLTEATSSVLTITGGSSSVIGSGTTIRVKQADSGTSGYLSSSDWSTFNAKQNALVAGTGISIVGNTISSTSGGANISATSPLSYASSSGVLSIQVATTSQNGYLTSTDWNTFNNKQNLLTLGNLTEATSSVLTITGGSGSVVGSGTSIRVKQADSGTSGFLTNTDWATFNAKQNAITQGNLTEVTSSVLTITGGSSSVIGSGTTIRVKQADSGTSGFLTNTDWSTFNNKYSTSGGIIYGNALRDTTGYGTAGAAILGFTGTGAGRLAFDGTNGSNGIQYSASALQMYSFHTLILQGNRNTTSYPAFSTKSDTGVYVDYRNAESATTALAVEIDSGQTGDIVRYLNNNNQVVRYTSSGILQLNNYASTPTTIPTEAIFHVVGNSNASLKGGVFDSHGSNGSMILLRKSRGTSTAPTAASTGDVLGQYAFDGYGTSGFSTNPIAYIRATANQVFTQTAKGTYMSFFTTPDASVSASERLRILASGDIETYNTGYLRIPNGTTAQRVVGSTSGAIRFNTTNSEYEAYQGTAWRHIGHLIPIQFSLTTQYNNSTQVFYYAKELSGVTGSPKVSVDTVGGLSNNSIDPWLAPFDGKILGAVVFAKGLGVANGSPTGPYTYRVELYNNTTSAVLLSTLNFSFPNGTTIGSFTSAVNTMAVTELTGLNIHITKGMNLGLVWVPVGGGGAGSVTIQEGVRVTLLVQKTY